jgi:hypothetical protein
MERESLRAALEDVQGQIEAALRSSGRDGGGVRLIAVSKTKGADLIRELYEAGQRDFGENYVQEMVDKAKELEDLAELRWHMIGHVQTNKVKMMMRCVSEIESVDSERLAREIDRRAQELERRVDVMIEVNVGDEAQKSGVSAQGVRALVEVVEGLSSLRLRGLMTVPPFDLEASETRKYFRRMRALREELGGEGRIAELSMGMSHDFTEAIDEGATTVRVGTAIFGTRERRR